MNKSLDLLLVNPSAKGVYQKAQESSNYPALEPPYLAALTAGFVRNQGYSVDILDANVLGLTSEQTAMEISDRDSKLTHFVVHGNQPSASSQLMDWVIDIGKKIKDSNSKTKILLTGTHPSALPELTLEERAFDFVGRGEGFLTPLGLLKSNLDSKEFSKVPGLWYKEDGKILRGFSERLMTSKELSEKFSTAAWDLLPVKNYRAHDWHCLDDLSDRQPYASIYTSFGCPFDCHFCCINAPFDEDGSVNHTIRFRNPNMVADEIEMLVKTYGIRNLKIIDEMFVLNRKHYVGLSNELIRRGLGDDLNIWSYARVDTINEGHLDTLKKAGMNWLTLGIESGSKHVRDGVEKGGRFGYEEIKVNVRKIQNAGIYVLGNYIFGLPDDTTESMQETLDLALELNCERPNFYSAMAYPGSALHRWARETSKLIKEGMQKYENFRGSSVILPIPRDWNPKRPLLPEDPNGPGWIGYSQHARETWPLPTETLHPEQVLSFRDHALKEYFLNPSYIKFLTNKFYKNSPEQINEFCEINSRTPERKILGK